MTGSRGVVEKNVESRGSAFFAFSGTSTKDEAGLAHQPINLFNSII
jgi:hypothetical protein